MPYRMVWEPNPKNLHMKVFGSLPHGVSERHSMMDFGLREAEGYIEDKWVTFHFCRWCKGWIEGSPITEQVNDLGMLSGRQGVEYYCKRCGSEIAFFGLMS